MQKLTLCLLLLCNGVLCNTAAADLIFDNPTAITIVDDDIANPYPSTISVSGVSGVISEITVTLSNISHTYPDDIAAVVVSPTGDASLLFSGPGGGQNISNVTWTFDDSAMLTLPDTGQLVSGTFRPGQEEYDDFFPAPGPGGKLVDSDPAPWQFDFGHWIGDDPNGDWNLFILDANPGDAGSIAGGWSINVTTAVPEPGCGVILLGLVALAGRRRARDDR
ncbi:MAG: hypothetical protein ACE361_21210 [Aureliella sp.]